MVRIAHHLSRRLTPQRRLAALALLLTLLGASSVPSPAHASAGGYQYWGGFHATVAGQTLRIPAGQLYHYISGSGFTISWEAANYGSVSPLCDTAVRFTYGYGAYEFRGNVHWGCSMGNQWKYSFGGWRAPRGSACAELWDCQSTKYVVIHPGFRGGSLQV